MRAPLILLGLLALIGSPFLLAFGYNTLQPDDPVASPQTYDLESTQVCDGRLLFDYRDVLLTEARLLTTGTGMITIRNRTDEFMESFRICEIGPPRNCQIYNGMLMPRGDLDVVLYGLSRGENRVGSHLFVVTPQNRECRSAQANS